MTYNHNFASSYMMLRNTTYYNPFLASRVPRPPKFYRYSFEHFMKNSYILVTILLFLVACNEAELLERYSKAIPIESWVGSDGETISTSHYNRIVVIENRESKIEVPLGNKWQWVLPNHMKVESKKYLLIPVQYCSQLRLTDEKSYKVFLVSIANGNKIKEVIVKKDDWIKLDLPLCSYPSLSENPKLKKEDA